MGKLIPEKSKHFVLWLPLSYIKWLKDHVGRGKDHEYVAEYVRYLVNQEILRLGPKPPPIVIEKTLVRRTSRKVVLVPPDEPPADTTSETPHPPPPQVP